MNFAAHAARPCFTAAVAALRAACVIGFTSGAFFFSGCATAPAPAPKPALAAAPGEAFNLQPSTLRLAWEYPYDRLEIVFNIYATEDLSQPMKWRATTPDTVWEFAANLPKEFFTVTASNVVDGTESAPATR